MMKRIVYVVSLLALLIISCDKTPVFPDPGLDTQMSVYDTVRRDTIDTYYYMMKIKVPNGLRVIQILDGYNYDVLEEITSYQGQREFDFRYPLDLKGIVDKDSTINRVVKVIDQDLRSYNKAFLLTVKPFSKPTIQIEGIEDVLGLESSNFELRALFETGLYSMKSFKVDFDGNVIDQHQFTEPVSIYTYNKILNLDMQKDREYRLIVTLTDDQGNVGVKSIKLRLIDTKRPLKVIINKFYSGTPFLDQEWEFFYNEATPERLDSIKTYLYSSLYVDGTTVTSVRIGAFRFTYDEAGNTIGLGKWDFRSKKWVLDYEWFYDYDTQNRLLSVRSDNASRYDIRVEDWYPDGRVMLMGNVVDWPVTDLIPWYEHSSGLMLNAEMRMIANGRSLSTKVSNVVIPTYQLHLPPFLPYVAALEDFQILTMWKYGVEWVHEYNEVKGNDFSEYLTDIPRLEYSYSTNVTGRLSKILKRTVNTTGTRTLSREWNFVYE